MDCKTMISLAEVNAMSLAEFSQFFGDVAEHSPWVAEGAADRRPFGNSDAMIAAFALTLSAADKPAQLALINAHPDLATKAKLTVDSSLEQAQAGLANLSSKDFQEFTDLNAAYKTKFGFPLIYAVKGATSVMILGSFRQRINHTPETEFATALTQITRIFQFRIEDRVDQT
jgi:2-oxo-4-hydroxy-4-carboxy-5-ureidoimidazoline decarboxylase